MSRQVRILILEDAATDAEVMQDEMKERGLRFTARLVDNERDYLRALREFRPEIILSDNEIPGFSGLVALEHRQERCPHVPFIFVSGTLGEEKAIECLKAGATDYVLKDRLARLWPAVDRALGDVESRRERQTLTEQLRQSQKMEALGTLAGAVAHDFNNLLTIILGYCERLTSALEKDHSLCEEVEEIRKAGVCARTLTSQLLAFSRQRSLHPTVFNVNKLISETEKMLRRLVGDRIELSVTFDPSLANVKADRAGIEQVLMNLSVNARDAMPEGGTLAVGTANMSLSEPLSTDHAVVPPGEYVVVAVRDTGIGMDSKVRARLFEPFFTTKGEGKGTGLGLSTALGIVQQSAGFITVESEPGRGTTFRIYLPKEGEKETPEVDPAPPPTRGGSETVLVVEDDRTVRRIATHVLKSQGYDVLQASRGEYALDLAERHGGPIHLIICDISLPGMTGLEVAQRLGEKRPEMKVLLNSGYKDPDVVPKSILEKGYHFLPKPYAPKELLRHVRKVLDEPKEE